jgi:hypothetical protein
LRILHISLLASSILLTGCGFMPKLPDFGGDVKPVEITTKAANKTPLALPDPEPVNTSPIVWYIITPENYQDVFRKLAEEGHDVVLFGITDDGYQELAVLIADVRNHINQQREILKRYREYYESTKPLSDSK